jgi:acyl-CoA dehydrogenase
VAFPHHAAQEKAAPDAPAKSPDRIGAKPTTRNAVAESENIVGETAERIFADLADAQTINRDNNGSWKAPLWQALSEAGLPLSWVPEDCGGSGASLAEGFSVLSAAGRFALAMPLAETMLAGWLLAQARITSPEGVMTVAPASPKDRIAVGADGTLSGRARGVPFAGDARHIAVLAHGTGGVSIALVEAAACRIEAGLNLANDGSDIVTFTNVSPIAIKPAPKGFDQAALMLMGGVARSLQIAGSLESMLDVSVRYSNERVAFEKKISKFQAVQHNLARLAGESAAALAGAPSARRSAVRRPRKRVPRSPIRSMARSDSPSSTSCIATAFARWRGGTISAARAIGPSNSASSSPHAAPTSCGRWWRRAEQCQ